MSCSTFCGLRQVGRNTINTSAEQTCGHTIQDKSNKTTIMSKQMIKYLSTALITFLVATISTLTYAAKYEEGVDYTVMPGTPSSQQKVLEFFSYSCPHCYTFDSVIEGYVEIAPEGISFNRVPVGFGRKDWLNSAMVYTVNELLNETDTLHQNAFVQIHEKNKPFLTEKDVSDFFEQNGVDSARYNKIVNSFSAKSKIRAYEKLARENKITTVPTIVVRDVYKVEISKVRNGEQLKDIVEYLMTL